MYLTLIKHVDILVKIIYAKFKNEREKYKEYTLPVLAYNILDINSMLYHSMQYTYFYMDSCSTKWTDLTFE